MERVRFRFRDDVEEPARREIVTRLHALGARSVERQFPTVQTGRRSRSFVADFERVPLAADALALLDADPRVEAARPDVTRDLAEVPERPSSG